MLSSEAQAVYDRITAKRGKIGGPYAPLMHHPALAEHLGSLGEYLRFESTLPGDLRELAILTTAHHGSQPFEWVVHAPVALSRKILNDANPAERPVEEPTKFELVISALLASAVRTSGWRAPTS